MSFLWTPAHCIPRYNDINICITYEKNKVPYCIGHLEGKTSQGGCQRSIIRCPDRTLIVYDKDKYRPLDTSYDEHVSLNVFSENSPFKEVGIGLISAEFSKEIKEPIHIPEGQMLVGDSGGYQLRVGKISFLDPYSVIDWMNKTVNVGVSVDVSVRQYYSEMTKDEEACIEATRRNNEVYKRYRRQGLRLLNVIHGSGTKGQRIWAERVYDDAFDGWAVGGDATLFDTVNGLIMLNHLFKKDHYHFFGKGATKNNIILAWLGKYVKLLTSDSTTYRNSGMSREIQLMTPHGMVQMYHVGKIKEYNANVATHIPCNCLVCQKVRYIDVYGLASKFKTERLLTWHNMLTLNAQARYWDHLSKINSYEKFIKILKYNMYTDLGEKMAAKRYINLKVILDFIEYSQKEGYTKAYKKYKSILENPMSMSQQNASLFDMFTETTESEGKRTLKSKSSFNRISDVSVDCLPNYLTNKELKEGYKIIPSDRDDFPVYFSRFNIERNRLIRSRGSAESFDIRFLRKHPFKKLKTMRKAWI